jgi:hypothetical protein
MTIAHATLTGAALHEPKGIATADSGTVYVADGAGSGSWSAIGTSSFTGAISAFMTPLVPTGWLECDGSDISTTTYSSLYEAVTIQQTGTRSIGTAIITGLTSTTHMRAGYFVFGSGFTAGTTIVSVDGATQITVSTNAASSGSATVIVSPWRVGTGVFRLPLMNTTGQFLRSRTSSIHIGSTQTDQNKAHTHSVTGTTATESQSHTHAIADQTDVQSASHQHDTTIGTRQMAEGGGSLVYTPSPTSTTTISSGSQNTPHSHAYSTDTGGVSQNHTHTLTGTAASDGGTEVRPHNIVVMYCVKI